MALGCPMEKRKARGCNVMPWAMFRWETMGPSIPVYVTLICATYKNSIPDQVHPFVATVPMVLEVISFSRITHPASLQKSDQASRGCAGQQKSDPWISILYGNIIARESVMVCLASQF